MPPVSKMGAGGDDEHARHEHSARSEEDFGAVQVGVVDDPVHDSDGGGERDHAEDAGEAGEVGLRTGC